MRSSRGVRLVLIDPWRRCVLGLGRQTCQRIDGWRAARQRHEVGAVVGGAEDAVGAKTIVSADDAVLALVVKLIIALQRNIDRAVAALGDQVEAVIEELAEECHPTVEARRQADVGRLVLNVGEVEVGQLEIDEGIDHLTRGDRVLAWMIVRKFSNRQRVGKPCRDRRRVFDGLVDDQVTDDARIGVGDAPGAAGDE